MISLKVTLIQCIVNCAVCLRVCFMMQNYYMLILNVDQPTKKDRISVVFCSVFMLSVIKSTQIMRQTHKRVQV